MASTSSARQNRAKANARLIRNNTKMRGSRVCPTTGGAVYAVGRQASNVRQTCVKKWTKATADVAARVKPTAALRVTHIRQSGQCYHCRATRTHHRQKYHSVLYQNAATFVPPIDPPVTASTRTAWQTQPCSDSSISRRVEWTNDRTKYPPSKKSGGLNGDHRILCQDF